MSIESIDAGATIDFGLVANFPRVDFTDKTTKDGVKNFFQGGDWATFFQEMPASIADTNFKAGVETP